MIVTGAHELGRAGLTFDRIRQLGIVRILTEIL